jgi:hypothetical protein
MWCTLVATQAEPAGLAGLVVRGSHPVAVPRRIWRRRRRRRWWAGRLAGPGPPSSAVGVPAVTHVGATPTPSATRGEGRRGGL